MGEEGLLLILGLVGAAHQRSRSWSGGASSGSLQLAHTWSLSSAVVPEFAECAESGLLLS